MSKKITFDGSFPRFSENGEYETNLDTNIIHRFYLDGEELKDKYAGKTDAQVREIELAEHEEMLAAQAAVEAAAVAEREAQQ
jgi:transposase